VLLADGGHAKYDCICEATERGVEPIIVVTSRETKTPDARKDPAIAARQAPAKPRKIPRAQACASCPTRISNTITDSRKSFEKVTCVALFVALTINRSPTHRRCGLSAQPTAF
jgi:hypothetical protein